MENVIDSDSRDLGLVSVDTFLLVPLPAPTPIIQPWLHEGEIALIHADAGTGKTWFALTLALIAATEMTCLGYTGTKVPVLYVDGEMSKHELQQRLQALCTMYRIDPSSLRHLHLLSRSLTKDDRFADFPDLCEKNGQDTVMELAKKSGAMLVVLDNYRTLASLPDENDATAIHGLNGFLKRLARGRAVIGVHHNNKSSGYSGSTALETVVSHRFNLKRSTPTEPGRAAFRLVLEKNRSGLSGEAAAPLVCELSGHGWQVKTDAVGQIAIFQQEAETLSFTTQNEAGLRFGVDERTVRTWVRSLEASGAWKVGTWKELTDKAKAVRSALEDDPDQPAGEGSDDPF